MEFNIITTTLLVSALALLLLGSVLLIRFDWFKGWLIGSVGLISISIAIICSVIILSFNSYLSSTQSDSVATISFKKLGDKKYQLELAETQGEKHIFELHGDMWQIDATILSWSEFFEKQGLKPYYRLSKINSSYSMLVDAERLPSSTLEIESSFVGVVLTQLAQKDAGLLLNSSIGSTGALPMADGALYSIRLTKAGLVSKPENQQAFASIR
jgi:hypothetical protein